MAERELQGILEGLRNYSQVLQSQRQQALEAQQMANEREARQKQLDIESKRLDQEHNYQQAQLDLAQKAAALKNLADKQQLTLNYQQTGALPAGSTVQQSSTQQARFTGGGFTGGQQLPAEPERQDINFNDENGRLIAQAQNVLSPQGAAQLQAEREFLLEKPKLDYMMAQQNAQFVRQAQLEGLKRQGEFNQAVKIHGMDIASELQRNRDTIAGENARNAAEINSREKIAMLPYNMFNNMNPEQKNNLLQPIVSGMYDGTMSMKDAMAEFGKSNVAPAAANAILGQFTQLTGGGMIPSDKQVETIKNLQPIVDMLPKIQAYIQSLPVTNNWAAGKLNAITQNDFMNPERAMQMAQLEQPVAIVARNLGGDEGQRLQKALLEPAEGGYLPRKTDPTKVNVERFNNFLDLAKNSYMKALGPMPMGQKMNIMNKSGLNNISKLGPDGKSMTVRFKEGSSIYAIPSDKVQAFQTQHPQAQPIQ
jgi:hypothetical protein